MTDDEKHDLPGAFDRVTAAVAGRPDNAYSLEMRAGDVVLLGKAIPDVDQTGYIRELLAGARNNPPVAIIWQEVGKLKLLLAKVKIPK